MLGWSYGPLDHVGVGRCACIKLVMNTPVEGHVI